MNNVTGWNELYDGNIVKAAYTMFDAALGGWFITLIFMVYLSLLMFKTKSASAVFVGSLLFVGLYVANLKTITLPIIVMASSGALASVIFYFMNKK